MEESRNHQDLTPALVQDKTPKEPPTKAELDGTEDLNHSLVFGSTPREESDANRQPSPSAEASPKPDGSVLLCDAIKRSPQYVPIFCMFQVPLTSDMSQQGVVPPASVRMRDCGVELGTKYHMKVPGKVCTITVAEEVMRKLKDWVAVSIGIWGKGMETMRLALLVEDLQRTLALVSAGGTPSSGPKRVLAQLFGPSWQNTHGD